MAVKAIDKYVIQQVKKRRLALGISQSQLAFELELSNGFIGRVETGTYGAKYSVSQLYDMAKLFGCSIKDFFPDKTL